MDLRARHQLRDLIVTAPEQVRQQLAGLARRRQVEVAARFRPQDLAGPGEGVRAAMASVAQRHQALAAEITRPGTALEELLTHAPAEFLAKQGVATQVAATLLATTGDNPGRVPHRGQLRRAVRRQPLRQACNLDGAAVQGRSPR
jgi:transposase